MKHQNHGYNMDLPPWILRWITNETPREQKKAHEFSKPNPPPFRSSPFSF